VGQFDHKPSKLQIRLPRQKEASAQKNVEPEEKFSMGSLEETYINDQNMEHLQKDYDDKLFRINWKAFTNDKDYKAHRSDQAAVEGGKDYYASTQPGNLSGW